MDELSEAGRLKVSTSPAAEAAAAMSEKGLAANIDESGKGSVPSESGPNYYMVDLVKFICECKSFRMGNLCKHIILSRAEAQRRGLDIESMRNAEAEKMIQNQMYNINDDNVTIFHTDGSISVVSQKMPFLCTCIANSHSEQCICIHVANILQPRKPSELPTDSQDEA